MFPSLIPPSDDQNRRINYWKPGEPTPRAVVIGFALILVAAAMMIFFGVNMFLLDWDRPPSSPEEAERMEFVRNNVRILGGINAVLGAALAFLAPKIRDGHRRQRRWALWIGALAIFFMLAGWVFRFTPVGQAVIALMLAFAFLAVYRPAAEPYFEEASE